MDKSKVLFVDDEPKILSSIRRGIIGEKYVGLYANSGKEAIEIMENEEIAVLVTDMRMPEMNGLELLQLVKEKYPNTLRIVLSGYAQISQVLATVNKVGVFKYIAKPWDLEDDFLVGIRQAVDYYNLQKINKELKIALEKKNILYKNMLKSFEDKKTELKSSFDNFIKLNQYFIKSFSLLESKIGKNNVIINNYVTEVNNFYAYYIDSILASKGEFDVDKISNELTSYIENEYSDKMINTEFYSSEKFNIKGDYKLLCAVLIAIINSIVINYYTKNKINIVFVLGMEDIKEEKVLTVYIKLKTTHSENINITHLNVLSAFLNELLKKTNGYIKCSGSTHETLEIILKNRY